VANRRTRAALDAADVVLACLRAPSGSLPASVGDAQVDLARLEEVLDYHRVQAAVADQLLQLPQLPAEWRQRLEGGRRQQVLRHLQVRSDLQHVRRVLDAVVPWVVLKGPAVAHTLYANPLHRQFLDLDVMVPPNTFEQAVVALEETRCQLLDVNWPAIAAAMPGELTFLLPQGTLLDLHWSFVNDRTRRDLLTSRTSDLFERVREVHAAEVAFPAPAAVDQLLHLGLHAFISGGQRLCWLTDLALAVDAEPDWEAVVRVGRGWGVAPAVGVMLQRQEQVLHRSLPRGLTASLAPSWRHLTRLVTSLRPPQRAQERGTRVSGTDVIRSTRSTTSASAVAFLHETLARRRSVGGHPDLRVRVDDSEARGAFFAQVRAS
jgi:hypothetical protein